MNRQQFIQTLSATLTKSKVADLVLLAADSDIPASLIHDLCYYPRNGALAFRAAWVLEGVEVRDPERFLPIFSDFVNRLPEQHNFSCQRHFSKILMRFTHPKASDSHKQALASIDQSPIVECMFEWLIEPRTPVAIRVNCMDILFWMSKEFDWIKDELEPQIEYFLRDGSAAMQSRGKKIAQQLKKLKPKVDP